MRGGGPAAASSPTSALGTRTNAGDRGPFFRGAASSTPRSVVRRGPGQARTIVISSQPSRRRAGACVGGSLPVSRRRRLRFACIAFGARRWRKRRAVRRLRLTYGARTSWTQRQSRGLLHTKADDTLAAGRSLRRVILVRTPSLRPAAAYAALEGASRRGALTRVDDSFLAEGAYQRALGDSAHQPG